MSAESPGGVGPPEGTASAPAVVSPISAAERITSIDVLRGVAVLGILVMNIQSFSMISAAYMNPTAYGDLTGANWWVWLVSHLLTDQKFMTIFSMLFGAGIVVFTSRAEAKGRRPAGLHYRRMLWLIIFGLLHAHLLWYGDILYFYGMCGLLVYLLRRLPPVWLVMIGVVLLVISSGLSWLTGWSMQWWPEEVVKGQLEFWTPTGEQVQRELNAYRGSWIEQASLRIPSAIFFETFIFFIYVWWRVVALMLIGMALFKGGFFSATRSRATYLMMIGGAVLIGLPLIGLGVHLNFENGWTMEYSMFIGGQFNYWASILVSLGWIGLVMLICQAPALEPITRPFAAAMRCLRRCPRFRRRPAPGGRTGPGRRRTADRTSGAARDWDRRCPPAGSSRGRPPPHSTTARCRRRPVAPRRTAPPRSR